MKIEPIGIGIIGCGAITRAYFPTLNEKISHVKIIGVADLIPEKAQAAAEKLHTAAMTNEEIYNHPDIQIVVNLTNVWSHYEVTKAALEHGKHVYCEKMMAETFEKGKELYDLAKEKGLRYSVAPDTFLGAGMQTCRKYIDDGLIGTPLSVQVTVVKDLYPNRPDDVRMNTDNNGGTIPFDMGGYYLHGMQLMFGPVKRVAGFTRHLKKRWSNPASPKSGEEVVLESPNFVQVALEFESGVLGSFTAVDACIRDSNVNGFYVYGTDGILFCPDPNTFMGPVKLLRKGSGEYMELPLTHGYSTVEWNPFAPPITDFRLKPNYRGIGVADMAWAITNNRPQRISNEMGLHAIEIIHGAEESCRTGKTYEMTTHPKRPVALRPGFVGIDAEDVFNDYFDEDTDTTPPWAW